MRTRDKQRKIATELLVLVGSLALCGYAQGAASNSPATRLMLKCQLSAEPDYTAGQPINLRFTLRSEGDETLYVLKWLTPLEGLAGDIFRVERGRQPVPYHGKMVKRGDPGFDDYQRIGPHASVSVVVNLAESYDLTLPGRCQARFIAGLQDVTVNPNLLPRRRDAHQLLKLESNTVEFRINKR